MDSERHSQIRLSVYKMKRDHLFKKDTYVTKQKKKK
jgi:hypothetical protein